MPYLGGLAVVSSCGGDIERSGQSPMIMLGLARSHHSSLVRFPADQIMRRINLASNLCTPGYTSTSQSTPLHDPGLRDRDENPKCAMSKSSEIGDAIVCLYITRDSRRE
jgi:hypothetical protein